MAEDIAMKVEVAGQALQTLDGMIAAVDKLTAAELRAAAAAEKVEKAINAAGGAGRGGSGRGGGGSGGGRAGGGSTRTIDEEIEHRLKRAKREEQVRAEMERRNPTRQQSFQDRVSDRVNRERDSAKLKDATDRQLGRGRYAPKEPPKSFDQEVQEKIAAESKRRAMKGELDKHFAAPPKTFDQEVAEGVASQRKRSALQSAIDARINPGRRAAGMIGGAAEAAGGGAMGVVGRLGPWGMAIAAGLAAFDVALKKTTEAANIERDGTLTRAQKDRGITEALVPFAQTIRKFRDAIDGTTETLARNERVRRRDEMANAAMTAYQGKEIAYKVPMFLSEERAGAYAKAGPIGAMDRFDRSTAKGARAAAEQDIALPAFDEQRRAGIEARAARAAADRLGGETKVDSAALEKHAKRADEALRRANAIREEENKPGGARNQARIDTAYLTAQREQNALARDQAANERLISASKDAGLRAAEAESRLRKANIGVAKAELEVLTQREQRMGGAAQRVGSMGRADREMSKAMARMVEEHAKAGGDVADLPQEMVEQAKAFLPERIAKLQEASGAKELGEFAGQNRGIDDSVLADFEKTTIAEVRAKVDKVKADVRVEVSLDEAELAKATAREISAWFHPFMRSIQVELQNLENKFDAANSQRYNSERP